MSKMFTDLHPELWDLPKLTNIAPGYAIRVNRKHDNMTHDAVYWPKYLTRRGRFPASPKSGPAGNRMNCSDKELAAMGFALFHLKNYAHVYQKRKVNIPSDVKAILEENRDVEAAYQRYVKTGLTRESYDVSFCTWKPGSSNAVAFAHLVDTGLALQTPTVCVVKEAAWKKFRHAMISYSEDDFQTMARTYSRQRQARMRIGKRLKAGWPMDIYDAANDRLWHEPVTRILDYGGWPSSAAERRVKLMEVQSRLPPQNYLLALMPSQQRGEIISRFMEELG